MYISKVSIQNYKSFSDFTIQLNKGLSVIIGENNVGKSNLLDALSLIFISNYSWKRRQLAHDDFYNGLVIQGNWPSIRVEVILSDILTEDEMALTCKWLTKEPGEAKITFLFRPKGNIKKAPPLEPTSIQNIKIPVEQYEWVIYGGEIESNDVFDHQMLQKFSMEYVDALRDATQELNRSSGRLHKIINAYEQDEKNKEEVVTKLRELNRQIKLSSEINKAEKTINEFLKLITGQFHQRTEIQMTESSYEQLLKDLKVLIGPNDGNVHSVETNGLGYNNLLYISLLLSQYFTRKDKVGQEYIFPILTVEEPEAHLHTHLQKYLSEYFFTGSSAGQILVTSHSTHITSIVDLNSLVLMYRDGKVIKSKQIGSIFGPKDAHYKRHLERWFDATKANIFFGRKTLLVEGIAEQMLIPKMAELYWNKDRKKDEPIITLDGCGISIISVDGVAFRPFLHLFGEKGLNLKCAVLTDSDPEKKEVTDPDTGNIVKVDIYPTPANPAVVCSRVVNLINDFKDQTNICIRTNIKTFEYDLIFENNWDFFRKLIVKYKLGTADEREKLLEIKDEEELVKEAFLIISETKGEAAQYVLDELQAGETLNIPKYIRDVLDFIREG